MKAKSPSLNKEELLFIKTVWTHYKAHGRHELPWRNTDNPYHILISELMLQQTQVARVIPKYKDFLKQFPTPKRLANAPLGDVLKVWQGLGYNRRAKFLWQAAQVVLNEHKGKWPTTFDGLLALPGVGTYTAAAVMNFAYNSPVPLIETNVRTAYIHHFFHDKKGVPDSDLLPIIKRTLDIKRPREWNSALMDYGAHLKMTVGNVCTQSKEYKKQSSFKESNRYVRGAVVRSLAVQHHTLVTLKRVLADIESSRLVAQLEVLLTEQLIIKEGRTYRLP